MSNLANLSYLFRSDMVIPRHCRGTMIEPISVTWFLNHYGVKKMNVLLITVSFVNGFVGFNVKLYVSF